MLRLDRLAELFLPATFLNDDRLVAAPLLGPPFFAVGDFLNEDFLVGDFLNDDFLNDDFLNVLRSLRSRPEPVLDFLSPSGVRPPVVDLASAFLPPLKARFPVENFLLPFLRPVELRSAELRSAELRSAMLERSKLGRFPAESDRTESDRDRPVVERGVERVVERAVLE